MKKIVLLCALALSLAHDSIAQAPQMFNYQGIARNSSGAPIASGPIGLKITILEGGSAGAAVYEETHSVTTNTYGLYNVAIGTGTVLSGSFAAVEWAEGDKYMSVAIDPAGGSTYVALGATQLLSVPYALYAANGPSSLAGTKNTLVKFNTPATGVNSQIRDNDTTVSINTPTPSKTVKFQVSTSEGNAIKATLAGAPPTTLATQVSIYGESSSGIGVAGISGNQNGVYGLSSGSLGGTVGVNSGTGNGLWGVATGAGTAGFFDGGTKGKGIIVSNGASGIGTSTPTSRLSVIQPATPVAAIDTFPAISAYSYTAQGCMKGAVYGTYNSSNYGTGIQGVGYNGINLQDANANFTTGNQDVGVYGSANTAGVEGTSVGGIGVVGYNRNSSFAATTGGGNAYGVYGYANTIGGATAPTTRYGVYGYAAGASTNIAGYFSGNVQVTGSLAKASGTFKIDHPLDPANKYLYHSFVESPDMMNIYNGNAVTDTRGFASISLPSYFDALNTSFRYQLTVIGTFAQAIVKEEIKGNQFVIQTSEPNIKVSWMVTGVRHDKYAEAHRVVPEVDKEPELKGYYLHPEEWHQPSSKGFDQVTLPKTAAPQR